MIEAHSDDAANITEILTQAHHDALVPFPPIDISDPSNPFNAADPSNIDLRELTKLRYNHQTKQAALGVRTSKKPSFASKQLSLRQQLHQNTVNLIKKQGEVGIGSGIDRFLRWQSTASGTNRTTIAGLVAPVPPTGNASNAAINAETIAKRVWFHLLYIQRRLQLSYYRFQILGRRKNIFCTKYQLPDILAEARITNLTPLHADGNAASTFGFVVSSNQQIMVCKGTRLSSQLMYLP